mmetsp:Transcript_7481/g.16041  ORF Transcript_7481/g.16041 Transcript_7481/m.16041 type:complete len:83 (+) Transcript_7481:1505-1753(+)
MCISILLQLGEIIPTEVTEDIYANEVAEVKKSLEGKKSGRSTLLANYVGCIKTRSNAVFESCSDIVVCFQAYSKPYCGFSNG